MQEYTHRGKMVTIISDEIGLGRNWFFTFSTYFHLKMIKSLKCILYTLTMNLNSMSYIQCLLVKDVFGVI